MPVRAETRPAPPAPPFPPAPPPGGPADRTGVLLARASGPVGLVLAGVLAVVVAGSLTVALRPAAPASSGPAPAVAGATQQAVPTPVPTLITVPVAVPADPVHATTLDVPALGIVGSALVELDVDAGRVLVPPTTTAVAGWFRGSAAPGEVGPTVIAGHVDSYRGPGIFFHLDDLRPGDVVTVGRSDGRSARYRVTDVLIVPKTQFPTDRVYGPTPGAELRLITCGGEFDHSARRYLRNVVVSGVLDTDYPGPP